MNPLSLLLCRSLNQLVNLLAGGNKAEDYEYDHQIGLRPQLLVEKGAEEIAQKRGHHHNDGDESEKPDLAVTGKLVIFPFKQRRPTSNG